MQVCVFMCVCVCASMCLCILQCHQGHSDTGMLVQRLKGFSGTCVVSGTSGKCLTTTDIANVT